MKRLLAWIGRRFPKRERLSPREAACCHMGQWGLSAASLASWRAEFAGIAASEKCRDCPLEAARARP